MIELAGRGSAALAISVIVPALDEAGAIADCMDSVGAQPGVEVVLSDGGSRDATVAAARAARPGLIVVSGPAGRGDQLNRGAAAAHGAFLVFLHADCRLPPGWTDAVEETLADPRITLGCFRLHTGPPPHARAGRVSAWWWRLLDLRGHGLGRPYGDQALFVRRETFDRVGGYPDIPLMEDVAFVERCLRIGRLGRVPLDVRTTARRFGRHPWRTRLATATFPTLFRCGVSPERLARWYGTVR